MVALLQMTERQGIAETGGLHSLLRTTLKLPKSVLRGVNVVRENPQESMMASRLEAHISRDWLLQANWQAP
jgi:hypothetical protein